MCTFIGKRKKAAPKKRRLDVDGSPTVVMYDMLGDSLQHQRGYSVCPYE